MNYETAKLRHFIQQYFGPDDLDSLLFDYFPTVREEITPGMTKSQQVKLILDYCRQHGRMPDLLAALQRERPTVFDSDDFVKNQPAPVDFSTPAVHSPAERNPRQIFLSHAHQDAAVAHKLAHDLEAHGYDIWLAPDSIRPGEKWVEAINRGLEESGLFILLLSPEAVTSRWVRMETNAAIEFEHEGEMQIFPLLLKACHPPPLWRAFHHISLRGGYEQALAALLTALEPQPHRLLVKPTAKVPTYARLAGAVEMGTTPTPLELPADLLMEMLSGEMVRVQDAVARWQEMPADDGLTEALRQRLAAELQNEQQPVPVRAGAGMALAIIGDQRTGVRLDAETGLPDIVWSEEISAGTYTIGGDKKAFRTLPEQKITIKHAYQLSQSPITCVQFQAFVEAVDFADGRWWTGMPSKAQKLSEQTFPYANHPREQVDWYQATAFCRWLSDKLGRQIQLPHEYEWEVAARWPDNRFYPWGNAFDEKLANTKKGGIGQPTAVGLYPANPLGLYDLSGNVWEWCRNKFNELNDDRIDSSGDERVLRGGSWSGNPISARAASRGYSLPDDRHDLVGFRLVVRRLPSHLDH